MRTTNLLETELQSKIEELGRTRAGTEEHEAILEEIKTLTSSLKDLKQVSVDEEDKRMNYELKSEQFMDEKKDRKFKNRMAIASLAVTTVTSLGLAYWTFRFDEKGSITSTLGRTILNKFIPRNPN